MRLNSFEIDTISELTKKHFGEESKIFLFGSRTDDTKKGGDIDLFIQNTNEHILTLESKIHFLAELKTKIGNRKIDLVFDNANTRRKKNFYRSITRRQIEL